LRKMKSNEMRDILIKNSTELFYKKGYASTSIRDIGRTAGISSATLYHYFKTKHDLLFEIIKTIGDHLLIILDQTKQEFDDPEERLTQMIFRQICLMKDKRKEVKIYMEEQYQLPPGLKKVTYRQHRRIYDIYLNELGRLHQARRLRINHLPSGNFAMFAVMNWVYRWYKEDKDLSIEEIANIIITVLFNGFLLTQK
jgi:TetR/AcrR family transcriptional regulator, cholesterol catabolism regulator